MYLDFVDEDVVERVDGVTGLLDVFADRVGDELVHGLLQIRRSDFLRDDLHHFTADVLNNRMKEDYVLYVIISRFYKRNE